MMTFSHVPGCMPLTPLSGKAIGGYFFLQEHQEKKTLGPEEKIETSKQVLGCMLASGETTR